MITIHLDSATAEAALARLFAAMSDLSQPMNDIGMALVASTEARFAAETAPDGTPWAPRSPATLARYQALGLGYGGILHLTGQMGGTIRHDYDPTSVEVGTDRPYAGVQQFGQAQGASGRTSRNGPIPWGDIPARPFLGLSAEDETSIVEIVEEWMAGLVPETP